MENRVGMLDQLKEKLLGLLKELNLWWCQLSLPGRMKARRWNQLSWPVRRKASWIRMQRYKMEQNHAKKVDALLKAGFMAEKGKWWLGREFPLASVTNYAKRVEAWLESGCKLRRESTTGWTSVDEQTRWCISS